jgi:hypothetical protein
MSQRIGREVLELRRAGQRLENASKEWENAYRRYWGALLALSRKTAEGRGTCGSRFGGLKK